MSMAGLSKVGEALEGRERAEGTDEFDPKCFRIVFRVAEVFGGAKVL